MIMEWLLIFAMWSVTQTSLEHKEFATEKECREVGEKASIGAKRILGPGTWTEYRCINIRDILRGV